MNNFLKRTLSFALALVMILTLAPVSGIHAYATEAEEAVVESFLPLLQKHIRNNDAEAISKMLIYPIHVSSPAIGDTWLENQHEFLKYYPQIFTEAVKKELLKLQNKDIFCNFKGMMINRGMWFNVRSNGKVYFYAIFL